MKTIHYISAESNRDEWLSKRVRNINSSDCASLFGLPSYASEYELWHRKKSGVEPEFKMTEDMEWGLALEDGIAQKLAKDNGLIIKKMGCYIEDKEERIGSSFDYEIIGVTDESPYAKQYEKLGRGLLEIKNVNSFQHKRSWTETEATHYIELQVQHQMLVSGFKWCVIGGCIGGSRGKVLLREYDDEVGERISQKVALFWKTIEHNIPPVANYQKDHEFIIAQNQKTEGEQVNLTESNEANVLVSEYFKMTQKINEFENAKKGIKARLLEIMGTAPTAIGNDWKISASEIASKPNTIITQEMVGQVQKGRSGYRDFRITEVKI